jgi:hypothetical protein
VNESDNAVDSVANDPSSRTSPPVWFSVVSIVALIWNLMNLAAFVMQAMMTEEAIASMPKEQQPLYENFPIWAMLAFAVATISGTLGCVGLLMRKTWAFPVFIVSHLGLLVLTGRIFLLTDALSILGPQVVIMPLICIVIGIALIVFSKSATSKGWLR